MEIEIKKGDENRPEKYWKLAIWNIKEINGKEIEFRDKCNKYTLEIIRITKTKERREEKQNWKTGTINL